jgi:hypothetical protein
MSRADFVVGGQLTETTRNGGFHPPYACWLFRTARGHKADALSERPMNQSDAWLMIRRRAAAAGIDAPIGNLPGDWDNRLPHHWRCARARAGNGRA